MARTALVVLLAACGACMETRETVQRMVVVRTTGSDLQPAATGYIYKKESDGPASVIQMGETEVMEQLSKLYEQPKAFAAPIPVAAGPFYNKVEDDKVAQLSSESKVIPVFENQEESDDHVDGIASEDYQKILGEYAADYGDYKSDFDDYLKGVGHFEHAIQHEHGDGSEYGADDHHEQGEKGEKGYGSKHHFQKGGAGDYHTEKFESYQVSSGGDHKKDHDDADAYGKHYALGHDYKGGDHGYKAGHSKGEEIEGFHNLYNKDEFKKDHDFYDGDALKGGFYKFSDGHALHGSDAGGFEAGSSLESGYHEDGLGKSGFHDIGSGDQHHAGHGAHAGGESSQHFHGDFATDGGDFGGRSYGYEIKH